MKKFRAYIELEDGIPTEMIISGNDKESARRKIVDFFMKLDKNIKVQVKLVEVEFDGNNYINKEDNNE